MPSYLRLQGCISLFAVGVQDRFDLHDRANELLILVLPNFVSRISDLVRSKLSGVDFEEIATTCVLIAMDLLGNETDCKIGPSTGA